MNIIINLRTINLSVKLIYLISTNYGKGELEYVETALELDLSDGR